ncbi:ParB/RepB/Spo0J family partition protein [Burkholderiaceae bacterium DAT-1]|nr:ParB/RepB/Spo0J family partition protein [Burkholderiaceae bacterium DAT-1]
MAKLKGLGRGLDALLGNTASSEERLESLPVHFLQPGRYQPRTHMDEQALEELANSIRSQGVIQPILVREVGIDKYEIIAGERRWRASQKAGLTDIPAVVRSVPDEAAIAMALIENIQREDLNPIEEAVGLKRLIDEFGMTHEGCAQAVGRSRSTITNLLRLLDLAEPVRLQLMNGALDMGHARALLSLPVLQQIEMAINITEHGWSVRETERQVQKLQEQKLPVAKAERKVDPDLVRLESNLSDRLGTKVSIQSSKKGSGKMVIEYASLDHLDSLLAILQTED